MREYKQRDLLIYIKKYITGTNFIMGTNFIIRITIINISFIVLKYLLTCKIFLNL